ncbi:hypothetical protein C4546_00920 [Candidatus Parcubacteria bacterium]|jgi:hypothetical protein|nr:MAG: hypothetical protein C4546_00920 [Candidatus Parcubacteria bacterium]
MIVFAASMGESYFDSHNALPWFFGLDFTQGPIYAGFFLILILAFWVVRHIFKPIITKLAGWYSANTKLPGQISVFALAVLFLGIYSFLGFHAGANLTKATGMRPAQATVAVLSDATSATLRFFANTLDEDSKFNESKGR